MTQNDDCGRLIGKLILNMVCKYDHMAAELELKCAVVHRQKGAMYVCRRKKGEMGNDRV